MVPITIEQYTVNTKPKPSESSMDMADFYDDDYMDDEDDNDEDGEQYYDDDEDSGNGES